MNSLPIAVASSTIGALELSLETCRRAFSQVEEVERGRSSVPPEFIYENFSYCLERTFLALSMVLEAAQLSQTREEISEVWKAHRIAGLSKISWNDVDSVESGPFYLLARAIHGVQVLAGQRSNAYEALQLNKLESLLKGTANLLHRRGISPDREKVIQDCMSDYLEVCFDDYCREFIIPGGLKHFKPDGGVRSLKAAIEFKFAKSKDEVNRALSGIFEDSAGYKGSLDWVNFYTVVYMSEPFELESRFQSELKRGECYRWVPFLVNGAIGDKQSSRARYR